jgi:lysyl-tRNA synthetase class 2
MALSEQEILRREALTELRNLGIEPYPQPNLLQPYSSEILADFEKYEGKKLF